MALKYFQICRVRLKDDVVFSTIEVHHVSGILSVVGKTLKRACKPRSRFIFLKYRGTPPWAFGAAPRHESRKNKIKFNLKIQKCTAKIKFGHKEESSFIWSLYSLVRRLVRAIISTTWTSVADIVCQRYSFLRLEPLLLELFIRWYQCRKGLQAFVPGTSWWRALTPDSTKWGFSCVEQSGSVCTSAMSSRLILCFRARQLDCVWIGKAWVLGTQSWWRI